MNLKLIAEHFLKHIATSAFYNSNSTCRNLELLYPPFRELIDKAIYSFELQYDYKVFIVETFRSNALQLRYYLNGASKVKTAGMHHFGIAVDCAFKVNGKFTYKGDIIGLREYMTEQGLTKLGMWDALHFQFIPVNKQRALRNAVNVEVKSFQKKYGLVVDGIIGKRTIAKLIEILL